MSIVEKVASFEHIKNSCNFLGEGETTEENVTKYTDIATIELKGREVILRCAGASKCIKRVWQFKSKLEPGSNEVGCERRDTDRSPIRSDVSFVSVDFCDRETAEHAKRALDYLVSFAKSAPSAFNSGTPPKLQDATSAPPDTKLSVIKTLGLELANMSVDLRKKYQVKDTAMGVVILGVEPNSPGSDKGLLAGDVVVEIAQETVASVGDVQAKIDKLKRDGRRVAVLLVSGVDGEVRFVALSLQ
jgi:hypothetical protein